MIDVALWLFLEVVFWILYGIVRVLFWPTVIVLLVVIMTPIFIVRSAFARESFPVALATQYQELIQACTGRARRMTDHLQQARRTTGGTVRR